VSAVLVADDVREVNGLRNGCGKDCNFHVIEAAVDDFRERAVV
jgi:hypothetical protein